MTKEVICICSATHNQRAYLADWYNGIMCQFDTLDQDKYELEVVLVIDEINVEESCKTAQQLWELRWGIGGYEKSVKYFNNNNFKIFVNDSNLGGAASFTKALETAKGDFICLLECDDYYKPGKLKESIDFIEANNLDGCHTNIDCILPSGEYREACWGKTCPQAPLITIDRLQQSNVLYTCSWVMKAEWFKKCPSPTEIKHILGDYAMVSWMVYNGAKVGWLDRSLSVYRDGIGVNTTKRAESVEADVKVKQWISQGCKRNDLCT